MTGLEFRPWKRGEEDAGHLHRIMAECMPQQPAGSPEEMSARMWSMIQGMEEAAQFALWKGEPVGSVALSNFQNPQHARMGGGVIPRAEGRGIGRMLLDRALDVARNRGCESVRTQWFSSNSWSVTFARKAGFVEKDRVFWSVFDPETPLPAWAHDKCEGLESENIRVVTGDEFETLREDWDRVWWRLVMDTMKDVPSEIPFEEMPFETYRPFLDLPYQDRTLTLLALEGNELAGLLSLTEFRGGRFNIQTTNVSKSYRRRGISTALKCAAIERVRALGGKELWTQNHEHNPMFSLNMRLGFEHRDTHIDGVLTL